MTREDSDLLVGDVATRSLLVAFPDENLHSVLVRLGAREVGRIPVVDRQDRSRLLGVLRRYDIIRAYTRKVREASPPPEQ
jgi:CIC family chloride channel protein